MEYQLLTNEEFVKALMPISDNLAGKYLAPSLMEAQEMGLKPILGSLMVTRLQELLATGEVTGDFSLDFNKDFTNGAGPVLYKTLLHKCQFYLAYKAVAELLPKISYKINNMGLVKTSDDRVENASREEVDANIEYYESKADFYATEIQGWVLANIAGLPEITATQCGKIRAHLFDAASCGIFLGGPRGRM